MATVTCSLNPETIQRLDAFGAERGFKTRGALIRYLILTAMEQERQTPADQARRIMMAARTTVNHIVKEEIGQALDRMAARLDDTGS